MNEYERIRNRFYHKIYATIIKGRQMEDEFEQWMRQTYEHSNELTGWNRQNMKDAFRAGQNFSNQLEPPVIVKLAEKRIDKLWKDKIPYVDDECDDIVEDIENEIDQLKKLVEGLKYYQENISKFSE